MRRAARALAVAALALAGPVHAQPVDPAWDAARALALGRTGALVPSERLRMLAFGRALGAGVGGPAETAALRADLVRQGFYHRGPPAVIGAQAAIRPLALADANLNGGIAEAALILPGGLVLVPVPGARAVGGLAFGAAAEGALRIAWSPGRFLDLRGGLFAAHAPGPALTLGGAQAEVCARNHLAGWTFADLCWRSERSFRRLSDSRAEAAEASIAHLWSGRTAHHEATLAAGWRAIDGAGQPTLRAELVSAWPGLATRAGVTLAGEAPGRVAERLRGFVELRGRAGGGVAGIALWASRSEGAFLGSIRRDDSFGATVFGTLPGGLVVTAGVAQTESSAARLDGPRLIFSVTRAVGP
jgi:hypothetical protein